MPLGTTDLIVGKPSTDVPRSGEPSPGEIALAPAQPSLDRWALTTSVQFTICLAWRTPAESMTSPLDEWRSPWPEEHSLTHLWAASSWARGAEYIPPGKSPLAEFPNHSAIHLLIEWCLGSSVTKRMSGRRDIRNLAIRLISLIRFECEMLPTGSADGSVLREVVEPCPMWT